MSQKEYAVSYIFTADPVSSLSIQSIHTHDQSMLYTVDRYPNYFFFIWQILVW